MPGYAERSASNSWPTAPSRQRKPGRTGGGGNETKVAAILPNKLPRGREAQPPTPSCGPPAIERVERVFRDIDRKPIPVVFNDYRHITTIVGRATRDSRPASDRRGLNCVSEHTPESVSQLARVSIDPHTRRESVEFQPNLALGGKRREVVSHTLEQVRDWERPRLRSWGSRELHQVAENPRDAVSLPHNRLERFAPIRLRFRPQEPLGVPRDDRERVIDLVPRAGGKFRQPRELRVAESFPRLFPQFSRDPVQVVNLLLQPRDECRSVSPPALRGHAQEVLDERYMMRVRVDY